MSSKEEPFKKRIKREQKVWDECAERYEASIVTGHPDVVAYTEFEEDFFDRILMHLMRDKGLEIHLYDVGCGSARLHVHYGLKSVRLKTLPSIDAKAVKEWRSTANRHNFNSYFADRLKFVGGLDFAPAMIDLAKEKLHQAGLGTLLGNRLNLEVGSAYDLEPFDSMFVPILVNVCNSIGVMQGEAGAQKLFQSMRRAVEDAGGVAIISCYRESAIPHFALGNYESTMNVSGQPIWLTPDTYASEEYLKIPKYFKHAFDKRDSILVDVYDDDGDLIEEDFVLKRDPALVEQTIKSGKIRMYSDYSSRWYNFEQIREWMDKYWGDDKAYHLDGEAIDCVRAQPAQLAIYDPADRLKDLFNMWWS